MPLPSVLVAPPWRRTRPRIASGKPGLSLPSLPPRIVWQEGERERFLGHASAPASPVVEERIYQRLADQLERQKPLPVADLARLSDEHLLEIALEADSRSIDVPGLKLVLSRLEGAILAHAISIVRSAEPERGLFEAMAPVSSQDLARAAAAAALRREPPTADALARPLVPTAAEAWLSRFPAAAAAGLVVPALHEGDPAHRSARSALAWVAARGGFGEARAVLEQAGPVVAPLVAWLEPFAALATLEPSWIGWLAGRGLDADAIARIPGPSPEAVPYVARSLGGHARAAAALWLETHRAIAEPVLEGLAPASEDARAALALLGGEATAGDPGLGEVPEIVPPLPAFFDVSAVPAPRLKDGTELPPDAVQALGEMLRFSSLARPYVGLVQVQEACDPASLDAFVLALLGLWTASGEAPGDLWVLDSSGKIGGEGCAREVARRVRAWARGAHAPRAWSADSHQAMNIAEGDRGWAYSRAGCMALAANGTDLALTLLDDLARTGAQSWLRREAKGPLEAVSARRKVRLADPADEMVPDLGLDPGGSASLDLGTRKFRVDFDEGLAPVLVDEAGQRSHTFPRARKDDDEGKAAAARARFQGLVKDTKALARQQIAQLEAAMCARRAWSLEAFMERFVAHPLLRHFGRRLVWATEDLSSTFRVAEDLSFADPEDTLFAPHRGARIVLLHPILIPPELRILWTALFGDYAILQPFPQLGRELFSIADEERGKTELARALGLQTSRGRLFQLSRRGWAPRVKGGWIDGYIRELPCGAEVHLGIDPSMPVGPGADDLVFTVTEATCTFALERLPPIDFSELVRDLEYLRR